MFNVWVNSNQFQFSDHVPSPLAKPQAFDFLKNYFLQFPTMLANFKVKCTTS